MMLIGVLVVHIHLIRGSFGQFGRDGRAGQECDGRGEVAGVEFASIKQSISVRGFGV